MQNMHQRQFTEKPLGLSSGFHDNYHLKDNPTLPNPIIPKQWVEPTISYIAEKKDKMPPLYSMVGAAVIIMFSLYGFVEMCILMSKAFLQAIK